MKKKVQILFLCTIVILHSCSTYRDTNIGGEVFQTQKMHAYGASKMILNKDSSFVFYGQGPSTLYTKGKWKYNSLNKELTFLSDYFDSKYKNSNRLDSIWIDFSHKKGKVFSNSKIMIDSAFYFKISSIK